MKLWPWELTTALPNMAKSSKICTGFPGFPRFPGQEEDACSKALQEPAKEFSFWADRPRQVEQIGANPNYFLKDFLWNQERPLESHWAINTWDTKIPWRICKVWWMLLDENNVLRRKQDLRWWSWQDLSTCECKWKVHVSEASLRSIRDFEVACVPRTKPCAIAD